MRSIPRSAAAGTVKSARSGAAQSIEAASSAVRTRPLARGGGSGGGGVATRRAGCFEAGRAYAAWRTVPLPAGGT